MPTDQVGGLNAIMQALRRRLADRSEKAADRRAPAAGRSARSARREKADLGELRKKIAARLGALGPEERTSPQAAIESALVWEFGEEVLTDPSFTSLAADIQQAIKDSPATRKQFEELLTKL